MIKRNKINRNKVKSGMSRRKKILLSAMIASSLLFADGLYTTYVYADGGQQIHGISVNVDPGGEPGNNYNNDGAGYLGIAIGNRASSLAGYGTAIGPFAKADALYSNATGFWAQALGQYSAAYGAGARAINNFGVAFGQGAVVSLGKPISEAEYSVYPDIIKKLYTAVKTETGATVYYQTKILLQNGLTQDQSVFSVAIGASAAATDNYAVAIGFKSSAETMGSLSIGAYSEAKGKQGLALGYVAKAIGDFSTAVGQWSQANGDHAVAIGYGAITEKNQAGVAIGYESHSMRAGGKGWNPITDQVWDGSEAQIEALGLKEKVKALDEEIAQKQVLEQQAKEELAKFPNDPDLIEKARVAHNEKAKADEKKNKLFATWKTPTGDVAVGNIDTGMTRQITGVAAGSEDTDAVNVAQLKALNRKVDAVSTEIKNKVEDNKIHYLSVGPEREKDHPVEGNYNNDGARTYGAIAIGIDSVSEEADAISIGRKSYTNGIESIGIGLLANATGKYATVVGHRAQAFGENASAYGVFSRAYGANGLAIGTAALAAGVKPLTKAEFDALPEEQKAWYNTDVVKQTEFYQYKMRDKTGKITDIITKGIAVGNYAESIGIGGVAVGDHAKSSDINNVNDSKFGVAIGAYSQNKVAQGVALGTLSVADRAGNTRGYLPTKNGIIEYFEDAMEAVGKGKEFTELGNEYAQAQEQMNAAKAAYYGNPTNTDLKMKYEEAKQKFDALNNKFAIMTAPWTSRKGAVSIGNDKKGQTRQIIGVAAGSEDTDAVNVAQLKALNSKVTTNTGDITTLKKGWTLKDANTGTKTVKAEGTVKVTGDDYITATVDKDGLKLGMNVTKLNTQINDQIDNSTTVKNKMNSWVLKAATTDKDPAAKGQTIDNTNNVATFDVETGQGLTVARNGATIKYGVNNKQLVGNINSGDTAVTNISAKFSVTDGTNTKAVNLGKDKNNNVKFLGTAGETTVTVGGNDDAPTVTVGLAQAFKDKVTKNATDITNLTTRVNGHDTAIQENKKAIKTNTENIGKNTTAIAKNAGDITTLTGRVDTAETTIKSNTDRITTAETTIKSNTDRITTAETTIKSNTDRITTAETTIKSNTDRITTAETTIKSNTDRITTAETTIKSNTDRITTAETTIKSNTDRIEKNATDIAAKMTSWTVKAGEESDGQKIDNDNNEVTFDVAAKDQGLTVTRDGSTIKYGIDGSKIDLSNNESIKKLKTVVKAGDKEKNISVKKADDKEEYTVTLSKDLKDLNSVSATTVNAGTVKADTVDTKTVTVGDKVTLGTTGFTIKDGPSVTAAGIDAGNNKITGVAAGAVSEKSTEAVNGGQLFGVEQKVNINNQNIAILGGKVGELGNHVDRVGAGVAALAALHPLDFDPYNRSQIMAGVSTYKGQQAIALGLAYYSNENTLLHAGLSYAGESDLMANVGISYRFGSSYDRKFLEERNKLMPQYKGGVISSVYVMQDEMTKLQKENEILKEKNAKAEAENKEMKSELEILKKQVSKLMEKI